MIAYAVNAQPASFNVACTKLPKGPVKVTGMSLLGHNANKSVPAGCAAVAAAPAASSDTAAVKDGKEARLKLHNDQQQQQQQQQQSMRLAGPVWQYSLNGVSAVLTCESPVSVASLVKMFEDHSAGYMHLSEVRAANLLAGIS
jgi:hypothetical protein